MGRLFHCRECGNIQNLVAPEEEKVKGQCYTVYCNGKKRTFYRVTENQLGVEKKNAEGGTE